MSDMTKKEKALAILKQWITYVNAGDLDGILGLFADDAVLLPTFSSNILNSEKELSAYFSGLAARPGAKVELDEASVLATDFLGSDSGVVLAGNYTFYFLEGDALVAYPSRFTFVMACDQPQPIVQQHSSLQP